MIVEVTNLNTYDRSVPTPANIAIPIQASETIFFTYPKAYSWFFEGLNEGAYNFKVEMTTVPSEVAPLNPDLDFNELDSKVNEAIDLKISTVVSDDGGEVPQNVYWVLADDREKFENAIAEALQAKASAEEQDAVDAAVSALESAISELESKRQLGTAVEETDTVELERLIDQARETSESTVVSEDGEDVYTDSKWVIQDDKDTLESAISEAETVKDEATAQFKVDDAVKVLQKALDTFTGASKDGLKEKPIQDASVPSADTMSEPYGEHSPDELVGDGFQVISKGDEIIVTGDLTYIDDYADKFEEEAELTNYFVPVVLTADEGNVLKYTTIAQNEVEKTFGTDDVVPTKSRGVAASMFLVVAVKKEEPTQEFQIFADAEAAASGTDPKTVTLDASAAVFNDPEVEIISITAPTSEEENKPVGGDAYVVKDLYGKDFKLSYDRTQGKLTAYGTLNKTGDEFVDDEEGTYTDHYLPVHIKAHDGYVIKYTDLAGTEKSVTLEEDTVLLVFGVRAANPTRKFTVYRNSEDAEAGQYGVDINISAYNCTFAGSEVQPPSRPVIRTITKPSFYASQEEAGEVMVKDLYGDDYSVAYDNHKVTLGGKLIPIKNYSLFPEENKITNYYAPIAINSKVGYVLNGNNIIGKEVTKTFTENPVNLILAMKSGEPTRTFTLYSSEDAAQTKQNGVEVTVDAQKVNFSKITPTFEYTGEGVTEEEVSPTLTFTSDKDFKESPTAEELGLDFGETSLEFDSSEATEKTLTVNTTGTVTAGTITVKPTPAAFVDGDIFNDAAQISIKVKELPIPEIAITATDPEKEISGKQVKELQSDVHVSATAVTGTLSYIEDYKAFTDPKLQSGNYLVLDFKATPDDAEIKVELQGGDTVMKEPVVVDDGWCIFHVTSTEQKLHVIVTKGSKKLDKTYALTDLTLGVKEDEEPVLTISVPEGSKTYYGKQADELQSGVTVNESDITGVLKYAKGVQIMLHEPKYQEGNFLVLDFSAQPEEAKIEVELQGGEPINPGLNEVNDGYCLFRITDNQAQKIKTVVTNGTKKVEKTYALTSLELEKDKETPSLAFTNASIYAGDDSPTLTLTSDKTFASSPSKEDLGLDFGETSLEFSSAEGGSTTCNVTTTGTASTGTITAQANPTAFEPSEGLTQSAKATAEVKDKETPSLMAETAEIVEGTESPQIKLNSDKTFADELDGSKFDFNGGETGINFSSATAEGTSVTIETTGTASVGEIKIKAKTDAFNPSDGLTDSAEATITVTAKPKEVPAITAVKAAGQDQSWKGVTYSDLMSANTEAKLSDKTINITGTLYKFDGDQLGTGAKGKNCAVVNIEVNKAGIVVKSTKTDGSEFTYTYEGKTADDFVMVFDEDHKTREFTFYIDQAAKESDEGGVKYTVDANQATLETRTKAEATAEPLLTAVEIPGQTESWKSAQYSKLMSPDTKATLKGNTIEVTGTLYKYENWDAFGTDLQNKNYLVLTLRGAKEGVEMTFQKLNGKDAGYTYPGDDLDYDLVLALDDSHKTVNFTFYENASDKSQKQNGQTYTLDCTKVTLSPQTQAQAAAAAASTMDGPSMIDLESLDVNQLKSIASDLGVATNSRKASTLAAKIQASDPDPAALAKAFEKVSNQ